jgi:hypothetical protein
VGQKHAAIHYCIHEALLFSQNGRLGGLTLKSGFQKIVAITACMTTCARADLGCTTKRRVMDPKDLKLTNLEGEAFQLSPGLEKIYRILWAVDPAVLRRFRPEILQNMAHINVEFQAKQARLEAQMKINEAEAFEAIAKQMGAVK